MKQQISIESGRLVDLFEAALSADYAKLKRLGSELAQACLEQGDEGVAKRLKMMLRRRGVPLQASGAHVSLPIDGVSRLPLIEEEPWPSTPVILNQDVSGIITRFLHDNQNAQLLRESGLLTRFGLMLSGPPGTGKTLLAGHIAAQLRRPFFIARLDSLISSRLGETAKNIRQIFDFAPAKNAVLLLDEIDAIAKIRDDRHELGELKRIVNTVIQGLDSLDDHAIVVAATNHPQLLDAAIWRRFPYHCDIGMPDQSARSALWSHFLYEGKLTSTRRAAFLGRISGGFSGADIENLALATRRLSVLNQIDLPEPQLIAAILKSKPPNLCFPELSRLTAGLKQLLTKELASIEGIHKSEIAFMLRLSRQMVHRYLQEHPDE
ncbi:MAG: AAA family ATPase [Methylocella sp.]|jgi:hypothetical protein